MSWWVKVHLLLMTQLAQCACSATGVTLSGPATGVTVSVPAIGL